MGLGPSLPLNCQQGRCFERVYLGMNDVERKHGLIITVSFTVSA